mgnify:CR=1 FL=1
MSIDPETFRHEAADTVHGQLQRGRGAGYLAALELPRAEAHRLLIDCIIRDPRIDSQVESRAEYYARLALLTKLPLEALAERLRKHDDEGQSGWNTPLTISTLGELCRMGNSSAMGILRDYVGWGNWWDWAVRDLAACQDEMAWRDLDTVVCRRFPDPDQLMRELGWFKMDEPAWKVWRQTNPIVAAMMAKEEERSARLAVESRERSGADLTVPELLARADQANSWSFRKVIREKVQPSDADALLAQLVADRPFAAAVALPGLAKLSRPEFFKPLLDFWRDCPEQPRWLRSRAAYALAALPRNVVAHLIDDFFNSSDRKERFLAEAILKNHATAEDASMLRMAITSCLQDEYEKLYRLCSLLEACKRLSGIGRIPELEQVFVECRYSYARKIAACAMQIAAPSEFDSSFSTECLWDCEADTRELGCQTVDIDRPGCLRKLRELATDQYEEVDVRAAASLRLQGNAN